ncbi:ABC transporter permease [Sphingomonas jatrophae]|uniref:Transport permease protein n=1 Tax=Sphingomonas jatrophae TaxID=1166337 RepID=A0A1I6LAW2_9SPHN|nr:ABC transporter permease [Sphingomonas jatrophae]SFS00622.1 ABC-2 type transport system permease protein [Sphingomonas jatrophae]
MPGPDQFTLPTPGEPVIPIVNWSGMKALYVKEVRRFFKVHLQTIWAPAINTLLYLVVFVVALGGGGRTVMGHPFANFVAPGLIVATGMMGSAFANSSFSLLAGKMNGTIVDYLMPPISVGEMLFGLVGAAITRAVLVGLAIWAAIAFFPDVQAVPLHLWAVVWFGLLGSLLVSFIGVLSSIWAEKFDQSAAITNFVVQPLLLLSGTFYSVERLTPVFRDISHANPFFYAISGFRYGFIGTSDSNLLTGTLVLVGVNLVLGIWCYVALAKGWRLKA